MIEYEKLYEEVKVALSEYRFNHSVRVVETAIKYAKKYGEDVEKIKLTAIAHDIAKEIPKEDILKIVKEMNVQLDEYEKINLALAHSKLGAKICKEKYGFTDEMCEAIRWHSTGNANMTNFEKIIYLADSTEDERPVGSKFQDIILKDIDQGMEQVAARSLQYVIEKNGIIHPDSLKCYNYYWTKNRKIIN